MLGNSNVQDNATDTRIACSNTKLAMRGPKGVPVVIEADAKAWNFSYNGEGFVFPFCDKQTGWNKREFADYTRFKWDRDHGAHDQKSEIRSQKAAERPFWFLVSGFWLLTSERP